MRGTVLAAAVTLLLTNAAVASDGAEGPAYYHVPGITFVLHRKTDPIPLSDYPEITWLDRNFTLECHAPKCFIDVLSAVGGVWAQTLCTYMDGKPLRGSCENGVNNPLVNFMQGQNISQGMHTFKTGLINGTQTGGTACPCAFRYTLYDSAN